MSESTGQPLCRHCIHWHRLRADAVVGRCDVEGTRGFSHEQFSCPAWESRPASAPAVAAKRPCRAVLRSRLGLLAAGLLADLVGRCDAPAMAIGL
jgi:hypothetical protein